MDIRIQKIIEGLFCLEDMREVYRGALPTGLSPDEEAALGAKLGELEGLVGEIRAGTGRPRVTQLAGGIALRTREETAINIQPIQAGGRLTPEARKALALWGDGYSVCDACRAPFRLDRITKPPLAAFHEDLAAFVGMDRARVVPGARRGFQAVTSALVGREDWVLLSSLGHYTEYLAVEQAGGSVHEIPADDRRVVTAEAAAERLDTLVRELGKPPALVMCDHFDYRDANEHDVRGVARAAHQYDAPFLYNGAYTVGVMPVDGKALGADFVVGSGHKSMAAPAPSGVLATTDEYAERVFRTTRIAGDLTGRTFGAKEVELLGCTLMGGTVVAMMASFPAVRERTAHWDGEVAKSNYFVDRLLEIEGSACISEYPRKHAVSKVDTTGSFDTVAKTHKRRGFFLQDELSKRGIVGVFAGATRAWKLSTYGLSWRRVEYLADAYQEIAEKYGLAVAGA
ncbi:MAG: O-phospho-L-seryl-tRNA:Cys-tRNA synthase [Methanospirillum sp.]|nr:O-phospho-L-seryl-tRNA:Cys-tRNA synthase [Methanospirillum sp.]